MTFETVFPFIKKERDDQTAKELDFLRKLLDAMERN